ncbi:MAG: BMP family ABC transporter substrate-binding protein [Ectothiorhodospiraceae bacterium AqS1]|nr:BMP family ABC transporter substrate-binding protein [Ectothiorhodospiraceae bacterium AqS1]
MASLAKKPIEILAFLWVIVVAAAGTASAEPAIIYNVGTKFDKSFNEMAYTGAKRWSERTGMKFREVELQAEAQREQAMRRFAEAGLNPVVMVGFSFATMLAEIAPEYPDTKFVLIDSEVEAPNVRSVLFNEQEGSYLVGLMAAMATKSGVIGAIGGMDIPLIRKMTCGYFQGAKAARADIETLENMTGVTLAAWNDPIKGAELARAQIAQRADVIYGVAGGTNIGIMQAAADEGILVIGVDSNQNHLHPGRVLTSMLKRMDNVVEQAFDAGEDIATGETIVMTLKNEGLDIAIDEHNEALVTQAMLAAVADAKNKIVEGEIDVHDYTVDGPCPHSGG